MKEGRKMAATTASNSRSKLDLIVIIRVRFIQTRRSIDGWIESGQAAARSSFLLIAISEFLFKKSTAKQVFRVSKINNI